MDIINSSIKDVHVPSLPLERQHVRMFVEQKARVKIVSMDEGQM